MVLAVTSHFLLELLLIIHPQASLCFFLLPSLLTFDLRPTLGIGGHIHFLVVSVLTSPVLVLLLLVVFVYCEHDVCRESTASVLGLSSQADSSLSETQI
jgi:hypothetical protein